MSYSMKWWIDTYGAITWLAAAIIGFVVWSVSYHRGSWAKDDPGTFIPVVIIAPLAVAVFGPVLALLAAIGAAFWGVHRAIGLLVRPAQPTSSDHVLEEAEREVEALLHD